MNDFSLTNDIASEREAESERREPITGSYRFECVELATELLDLGGWVTGSQIDFLEGVSFGRICDHDTLQELQDMRDSRQREINLNK